jgi:hypothetical protein
MNHGHTVKVNTASSIQMGGKTGPEVAGFVWTDRNDL